MPDPAPVTIACLPAETSLRLRQFHHVPEHIGIALEVGSAVEVEHLAGQPGRFRRAQEDHGIGDLLGLSGAAERGVLEVVLDEARHQVGALGERGVDEPGGDRVDADSPRAHLQRRDLGEHRQAGLGRAVGAHADGRLPPVQRADRHQRAAFAQLLPRVLGDDERRR